MARNVSTCEPLAHKSKKRIVPTCGDVTGAAHTALQGFTTRENASQGAAGLHDPRGTHSGTGLKRATWYMSDPSQDESGRVHQKHRAVFEYGPRYAKTPGCVRAQLGVLFRRTLRALCTCGFTNRRVDRMKNRGLCSNTARTSRLRRARFEHKPGFCILERAQHPRELENTRRGRRRAERAAGRQGRRKAGRPHLQGANDPTSRTVMGAACDRLPYSQSSNCELYSSA